MFRWLPLPAASKQAAAAAGGGARLALLLRGKPLPESKMRGGNAEVRNKPYNSAMAPPALFKNFGKASADLFKDDDWSATHKLDISNKNAQQSLTASVNAAGKSE
jgi:hypothetical protein